MAGPLDGDEVLDYFSRPGTVRRWWTPEEGPLRFHYEAERKVVADRVGMRPGRKVLDVGTGRGRFGIPFAQAGCRVVAVDLNPEMLEAAAASAREAGVSDRFEPRRARADQLDALGTERFDVVLCMELFDHLPDLGAVIASVRSRIESDGRFVFTYVPSASIYGLLGNAYRRWSRWRRPHEALISRTYTLRGIRRLLAEHHFALEGVFGVGLLCMNAQTRLAFAAPLTRALTAVARAEARRWPYHTHPWLAPWAAHVVGIARPEPRP